MYKCSIWTTTTYRSNSYNFSPSVYDSKIVCFQLFAHFLCQRKLFRYTPHMALMTHDKLWNTASTHWTTKKSLFLSNYDKSNLNSNIFVYSLWTFARNYVIKIDFYFHYCVLPKCIYMQITKLNPKHRAAFGILLNGLVTNGINKRRFYVYAYTL